MLPEEAPNAKTVEPPIPLHLGEKNEKMLAYFCNHLVALAGSYVEVNAAGREVTEPVFFSFSGFILSVRGIWSRRG